MQSGATHTAGYPNAGSRAGLRSITRQLDSLAWERMEFTNADGYPSSAPTPYSFGSQDNTSPARCDAFVSLSRAQLKQYPDQLAVCLP